jgi:hypothetical protein
VSAIFKLWTAIGAFADSLNRLARLANAAADQIEASAGPAHFEAPAERTSISVVGVIGTEPEPAAAGRGRNNGKRQ